jgi:hypothetical protein
MNTPRYAPSLKGLQYDGLAKKMSSVMAFYKKYPSKKPPEVSADDPKTTKRQKS